MQNIKKLIITNNPMVYEVFSGKHLIIYDEKMSFGEVFKCVRDNIHSGRKLLTHPLSGSVKPYETPYKTVIVTEERGKLDMDGLSIIEESIVTAEKFIKYRGRTAEKHLKDYQLVDFNLVEYIISDY